MMSEDKDGGGLVERRVAGDVVHGVDGGRSAGVVAGDVKAALEALTGACVSPPASTASDPSTLPLASSSVGGPDPGGTHGFPDRCAVYLCVPLWARGHGLVCCSGSSHTPFIHALHTPYAPHTLRSRLLTEE
jgi:hypothetical protein